MAELQEIPRKDLVVEMGEQEAEMQGLVPKVLRVGKGDSKARAAYRAEMEHKRSVLLLLMIVPVVLIIIAWYLFDTNSKVGIPTQPSYGANTTGSPT